MINNNYFYSFQPIPLISTSRWLVKKGDLMCLHEEGHRFSQLKNQIRQMFKGKFKPIYVFLFTDIVLITKMKGDDKYKVNLYFLSLYSIHFFFQFYEDGIITRFFFLFREFFFRLSFTH